MQVLDIQLQKLDEIGLLSDKIAADKEQLDAMKDVFKNAGEGKYEGSLYCGTVYLSARDSVDYNAILTEMGVVIPKELLAKHKKQSVSINMKISRRKGK